MCILLQHANHKELLTSTNNGIKTVEIAVTTSKRETRCCINISYYRYHICTSNSMGSSEIWDKYHECCIGNGDKFHEAKPSEIYHFQYNKSGIYPKFHCYPCYSQLIPYSLHIRMLCISIAMYAICHYVLNTLNTCRH